jgi:hypothetical protein
VISRGERVPDARVWLAPDEATTLAELAREGPALFLFYLFDWSAT